MSARVRSAIAAMALVAALAASDNDKSAVLVKNGGLRPTCVAVSTTGSSSSADESSFYGLRAFAASRLCSSRPRLCARHHSQRRRPRPRLELYTVLTGRDAARWGLGTNRC